MLLISSKLQKLLVITLSLCLVFWSAVSAHRQILCISDGHSAIESVLDSCCEHDEASEDATVSVSECGNCTDLALAFRAHQTSNQLELPSLEHLLINPIFVSRKTVLKSQNNFYSSELALDHNLIIKKITVLLV